MIWQDAVITAGQWFFALSLIPTLLSEDLPPLLTSISTGLILIIFGLTFYTLDLWNSGISSTIVGLIWLMITFKKIKSQK